jgi:aminopeptidase N
MQFRRVLWTAWFVAAAAGRALGAWGDGCGEQGWAPPPQFDEATGRDLLHYPPRRSADITHIKLDIVIPDMNVPRLTGAEDLSFTPLGDALESWSLHARAMTIRGVACEGRKVAYTHDGERLAMTFDPPVPAGERATVRIAYEVNDAPLGLIWTPESPAWPGRPAQIHTQGQPETNSYWFPCHDYPNERATTELIVSVPAGYTVSSNGRLLNQSKTIRTVETTSGSTEMVAYDTFHWLQDKPHVAYLVSMVVGRFDVVDVGTKDLAMPVYVPPGRGKDVPGTFGRTKDMVAYFARVLDEPYPWDRYAQVVVWNFGSGGMENTSCTTLHDTAVIEPSALNDHDYDGLIAHELAHQWFGDLVTCNSWDHVWLNEGMATFMNTLWIEQRDGKDAYHAQVRGSFDGIIAADKPEAPAAVGMVSRAYRSPWDAFQRPANPYGKGASILHMLRVRLGDDLFFKGLARYIDDRKFQTAETLDLRRAFEAVSGDTLEQFFTQWCTRPGTPSLDVKTAWDEGTKTWTLRVAQTQRIDGDNPAYEFDLPVYLETGTPGQGRRVVVAVKGRSAELAVPLDAAPSLVAIDPDLSVLGAIRTDLDEGANMAGLERGPTLPARMQAARGLAKPGAARVSDAIRRMVMDAKHPTALRVEMVKTLLGRGDMADLRSLFTAVTDSWEVREELTRAVADLTQQDAFKGDSEMRENIAEQLAARAGKDASLKVRAAALRGLGKLGAVQHAGVIGKALDTPSQSDILRQAALDALGSLDTRQGLDAAILLTRPGHDGRTREAAAAMVGRLGHHDKDQALGVLRDLLRDRELRTRRGAGAGLVALKDERALAEFEKAIKDSRAGEWTIMLTRWSEDLREAIASKP